MKITATTFTPAELRSLAEVISNYKCPHVPGVEDLILLTVGFRATADSEFGIKVTFKIMHKDGEWTRVYLMLRGPGGSYRHAKLTKGRSDAIWYIANK